MNPMKLRTLATGLSLSLLSLNANALTFVLDFTSLDTAETLFGTPVDFTTDALDPTDFGFTAADLNTITSSVLSRVTDDFTGYPTLATDASSPIPIGKELAIDFEIGTVFTAPTNGDTNYYFMKIGDRDPVTTSTSLGHACVACVRSATGTFSTFFEQKLVGSILSDNISSVSHTPGNLEQVTNLLAGTISHEIGHSLSLPHVGITTNPGASSYPLLSTGASPFLMPNSERILDRDFSYAHAAQLVTAVGLRDVSAVPLPASVYLFGFSLAMLGFVQRRRKVA